MSAVECCPVERHGSRLYICLACRRYNRMLGVKNLALNIRDCVSLVGRGSSVVGAPLQNLAKFVQPTLPTIYGQV